MKSNIQRVFRKRMMMGLLAILFIVGSVCVVNVNGSHALANNTVTSITLAKGIDYKLEKHSDIREYRKNGVLTAPKLSDASIADKWIFAGWYQDEACKKVLSSSAVSGEAYAKFVPVDVLSVKCQISADTTPESTGTLIRCISSVDSLKYKQIGFEFITPNGTQYMQSKKVGTRINALNEGNDCSYSPKVVDTESEYFFSAVYKMSKKETDAENGINKEDFDTTYIVKPYWVTSDGTTVYGMSRCISVNEALEKDVIHIPVKMTEAPTKDHALTANSQTLIYVDYDADSQYAHYTLSINSSLDSATKYNISGSDGNGNTVSTSFIYRNLGTKYNGTNADDSWYEIYNTDDTSEDEYVIVTSADLYGMATVTNTSKINFSGKTVYVVADIAANNAEAVDWETGTKTEGATVYPWTPIAKNSSYKFAGTFDAQRHMISGVYLNATETLQGLFAYTNSLSTIKNLKLVDSYFATAKGTIGSIVGQGDGIFDTIYSNATVSGGSTYIGGMIGKNNSTPGIDMNNCWFAGSVTQGGNDHSSEKAATGGLIGVIYNAESSITNCLNTGNVTSTYTVSTDPCVGGFVGRVGKNTLTIANCLNIGTITVDERAESSYGPILGDTYNDGNVSVSETYTLTSTVWDGITAVEEESIKGTDALTSDIQELFTTETEDGLYDSYWAVVPGNTPILTSFGELTKDKYQAIDTKWYDGSGKYTLKDVADFYGFALLSYKTTYAGDTIELGADIIIDNDGESKDWATNAPDYEWVSIGSSSSKFGGSFDGKGHTIRGVYLSATENSKGLFGTTVTTATVTIENFSLTNSYFTSTAQNIGSVVGEGNGTYDTIYSDAIVVGADYSVGGIIGKVSNNTSSITMNKCWFAGSVTNSSSKVDRTGGLVGNILYGATITNCLNSGKISQPSKTDTSSTGGLVGYVDNKEVSISGSLNVGIVTCSKATDGFGAIVGYVKNDSTPGSVTISNTYATSESCANMVPSNVMSNEEQADWQVTKSSIMGINAFLNLPRLDHNTYWSADTQGTPILKEFGKFAEGVDLEISTRWYDGSGNYTLYTAADLYGFAMLSRENTFVTETITLGADITLNKGKAADWATKAPDYNWTGIGYYVNDSDRNGFAGTFDGNGKSINGVYLNSTSSYAGLFGYTDTNATIKKLKLTNSYFFTTKGGIGSIVGKGDGTFDTIYSNAIVDGTTCWIGGLVGLTATTSGVTMNNCWFGGTVTQHGEGHATEFANTGGLVGVVNGKSTFTNCLNTGEVTAEYTKQKTPCVAGLVGRVPTDSGKITVKNCLNTGVITVAPGANNNYGPIIGVGSDVRISASDTYALTDQLDTYSIVPAGVTTVSSNAIKGTDALSAMANLFLYKTEEGEYKNYWAVIPGKAPVLSSFAEYAGEVFVAIDTSWYDGKDNYILHDAGDLYGFALLSNEATVDGYKGKTITLGQDITINEGTPYGADGVTGGGDDWADKAPQFEWLSICGDRNHRFAGTFKGNSKTISGLYLNETNTARGFFGWTEKGSVVENFSIVNSLFKNTAQAVGSVVGNARGSFDAIYSNADVIGEYSNVGGLIGQISGDEVVITNCWFDGTVTNTSAEKQSTGGIVGAANVSLIMENCLNTGTVSAPNFNSTQINPWIGGLIGHATPTENITVQHCLNTGKILFNSVVTEGFGSIIGRIVDLPEDNPHGDIVVQNTYATSQSCWRTVSTSNKWFEDKVAVVDGNTIGGDNAKAQDKLGGLFDETLTTKWVVSAKHPVLEVFEKYAPTEKNVTALHEWITSMTSLTATLQNPVTLPNPDGYSNDQIRRQGGYTDGEYFYQAYITYTDPGSETLNIPKESRNRVKVLKYDLTTGEAVWSKTEMELTHANDITYNSKLERFVVCHGSPNANKISYLKITEDDIVLEETVTLNGINIYDIDYNATKDVYVAMGDNYNFYVLNSNFQKISQGVQVASDLQKNAWQGVTCDDDYIYFVLAENSKYDVFTRLIAVYDWSGKQVSTVTLDIQTSSTTFEPENISVVGNKIYIMVAEETANSKPANVYTIDLTKAE